MEALQFYAVYPNVSCAKCRKGFEEDGRNPPCDDNKCPYTKEGDEPPIERLDGYSALAWNLWNEKEVLGWQAVEWKLSKMNDEERCIIQELLKEIEIEAINLNIKPPQQLTQMLGGIF